MSNCSPLIMSENAATDDHLVSFQVLDREGFWHTIQIPDDLGLNVMEACRAAELPMTSICGGMALCGQCHIYILSDQNFSPISDQETETLDKLSFLKNNSRLSCQIHVDQRIDGLKIQMAPV